MTEFDPITGQRAATTWGLGQAAAGLLAAFVLSSLALSGAVALTGATALSLGVLAVGQLGLWAGLAGAPLWAAFRAGGTLAGEFGLTAHARDAAALVAGAACQLALLPALYWLLQHLTGALDVSGPARDLTGRAGSTATLVILALLVSLAAPVIEEVFYRGLLLRALARRYGTVSAVVGSSAVFAGSHFQPVQFPGLFVFAVVLAVLTIRTGRLGPAIFAHAAFNAVTMIALGISR